MTRCLHRGLVGGLAALLCGGCAEGAGERGDGDAGTADASGSDATGADDNGGPDESGTDDAGSATDAPGDGSDDDATGGEPSMACSDAEGTRSALGFDGVDDHVTMGVAPALGLETFTVEAWVRRDGAGEEAGTGAGGIRVVPIAGKGRGENDDTIYNCNYQFGFHGNVLGADFEDAATGANHPIVGSTAVTWGEWHHVAVTYDGATWRLYVDGGLDAQSEANATPRADSIQHFAIGTAMDSAGTGQGAFDGAIDEVRVWSHARSEAELAASMRTTLVAGDGLVGRWALDEADGGAPDTVGDADGTLAGATFVPDGAALDQGVPPTLVSSIPADAAALPADGVELEVTLADPDADDFVVTFHVREVVEEDDFAIVVLPDTQYYSDVDSPNAGNPQYFHDQTQWVRDNREAYNILAVLHNGDIVNHGSRPEEWVIANAAMARLETPEPGLPEGVPYGVSAGNHDLDAINDGASTNFNQHYGVSRFAGRSYYGGHYSTTNDENWVTFWAGGLQFVMVSLKFDLTPDPAVLDWTRSVFEAHPDAFGILNTHYILTGAGNFSLQGGAIYEELKATENVHLMTCGHVSNEQRRTDVYEGHAITSMLADYQADGDGGSGFMRIWEFSPANDELTVRTYSPSKDTWLTDANSEFTLEVDLNGAGGPFEDLVVVDPASNVVTTQVNDLMPGRTYEWYATVSDCAYTTTTPVQRFTTDP